MKNLLKNNNLVDYVESPFSTIVAKEDYIEKVVSITKQKYEIKQGTLISKELGIELRTWKNFIGGKSVKSATYYRLSKFCQFSDEQIREGIRKIDNIEFSNLPLNFDSKDGVRLDCGVINEGRIRSRGVEYTNKDKEVLDLIKNSAKKLLGENFSPTERMDQRDQTVCLSFPPFFAKHFLKLGISGNKNNAVIRIPNYILDNEEYCKIWWQANISEEASIYAFVSSRKKFNYIVPRIQINRAKSINLPLIFNQIEKTYFHRNIPIEYLDLLKNNISQLILDEAKILDKLGIKAKPHFSKLYVNKK